MMDVFVFKVYDVKKNCELRHDRDTEENYDKQKQQIFFLAKALQLCKDVGKGILYLWRLDLWQQRPLPFQCVLVGLR